MSADPSQPARRPSPGRAGSPGGRILVVGIGVVGLIVITSALAVRSWRQSRLEAEVARRSQELASHGAQLALAQRARARGEWGTARDILESCPEHLRGWEWWVTWRRGGEGGGIPWTREFTEPVEDVGFRDSELLVLTRDPEHNIRFTLWDFTTGERILEVENDEAPPPPIVQPGGLSPRGGYLLLRRTMWDLKLEQKMDLPPQAMSVTAVGPNERWMVGRCREEGLSGIWNLETLERVLIFEEKPTNGRFSPSGRLFFAGTSIWDLETGQLVRQLSGWPERVSEQGAALPLCCFDIDERRVAMAGTDLIQVYELATESPPAGFGVGSRVLDLVAVSPDRLIVSEPRGMTVWSFDGHPILKISSDGPDRLRADGARLLTASGRRVQFWDGRTTDR